MRKVRNGAIQVQRFAKKITSLRKMFSVARRNAQPIAVCLSVGRQNPEPVVVCLSVGGQNLELIVVCLSVWRQNPEPVAVCLSVGGQKFQLQLVCLADEVLPPKSLRDLWSWTWLLPSFNFYPLPFRFFNIF